MIPWKTHHTSSFFHILANIQHSWVLQLPQTLNMFQFLYRLPIFLSVPSWMPFAGFSKAWTNTGLASWLPFILHAHFARVSKLDVDMLWIPGNPGFPNASFITSPIFPCWGTTGRDEMWLCQLAFLELLYNRFGLLKQHHRTFPTSKSPADLPRWSAQYKTRMMIWILGLFFSLL